MNEYQVRTDIYNGPMDLLLYLIRRDEIDLYDIPLAQVTQTYCDYVALLQTIDPNIAGDFLVMAATLMEMKSRMLLPRLVAEEGEPEDISDPRLELVRQLLEYKKFKDASFELGHSAHEQSMKWPRVPAKIRNLDASEVDLEDVQIWDLVGAFNKLMSSIGAGRATHDVLFDDTPISLHAADVVDRIAGEGGEMIFDEIFIGRTKVEMVGLFLALLELMRQRRVRITQHGVFSPIHITLLSAEPIEVGEGIEATLSEAVLGEDARQTDEQPPIDDEYEAASTDLEATTVGDDESPPEREEASADGEEVSPARESGERRAPRKHWKEPIASFDIEKDELFSELEHIKTDFDIDAIIRESKQRGRRPQPDGETDANAETADATTGDAEQTTAPLADDASLPAESDAMTDVTSPAPANAAPADEARTDETAADETPAQEASASDDAIDASPIDQPDMDEPTLQPNTESDPS